MKQTFADQVARVINGRPSSEVTRVFRGRVAGSKGQRSVKIYPNGQTVTFRISGPDGKQEIVAHTKAPQVTAKEIGQYLLDRGDTRVSYE